MERRFGGKRGRYVHSFLTTSAGRGGGGGGVGGEGERGRGRERRGVRWGVSFRVGVRDGGEERRMRV